MLRLHWSCAVVVEVVLKLKLLYMWLIRSYTYVTGFQPNSVGVQPNNLLTFEALLQIDSAHGCGVWGVGGPSTAACYVCSFQFRLCGHLQYVLYTVLYCIVLYTTYTLRMYTLRMYT